MTTSPLKKIGSLFSDSDKNLGDILKKSMALVALNRIITEQVDPDLAKHCSVINIHQGRLTIACESAEWLTLLRFESPALLQKLRRIKKLEHIASIRFKIIQREYGKNQKQKNRTVLSRLSAEHIRTFADQTTDPRLKEIFYALARRVKL